MISVEEFEERSLPVGRLCPLLSDPADQGGRHLARYLVTTMQLTTLPPQAFQPRHFRSAFSHSFPSPPTPLPSGQAQLDLCICVYVSARFIDLILKSVLFSETGLELGLTLPSRSMSEKVGKTAVG